MRSRNASGDRRSEGRGGNARDDLGHIGRRQRDGRKLDEREGKRREGREGCAAARAPRTVIALRLVGARLPVVVVVHVVVHDVPVMGGDQRGLGRAPVPDGEQHRPHEQPQHQQRQQAGAEETAEAADLDHLPRVTEGLARLQRP